MGEKLEEYCFWL